MWHLPGNLFKTEKHCSIQEEHVKAVRNAGIAQGRNSCVLNFFCPEDRWQAIVGCCTMRRIFLEGERTMRDAVLISWPASEPFSTVHPKAPIAPALDEQMA